MLETVPKQNVTAAGEGVERPGTYAPLWECRKRVAVKNGARILQENRLYVQTGKIPALKKTETITLARKWMKLEISRENKAKQTTEASSRKTNVACVLSVVVPRFCIGTYNQTCTYNQEIGVKPSRGHRGNEGRGEILSRICSTCKTDSS